MKRGLKLFVLLLCVITLVGCGNKSEKDNKEEVKKVDVREDINDCFTWIGSYRKDDADIVAEFYVDAYNQDIILTFTQFDEGNVSIEGDTIHYSSGNSRYVTLYADTMTDKKITFDSFGTTGVIKKTEKGLEVSVDQQKEVDEESDYSFMAGTYTFEPSTYELSGFYYNDNVHVAISAAGGYVYVASYVKKENYSDVKTYHIEDSKTLSFEDIFENEKTTINSTKKGIKIESDDENLTGEYELLK